MDLFLIVLFNGNRGSLITDGILWRKSCKFYFMTSSLFHGLTCNNYCILAYDDCYVSEPFCYGQNLAFMRNERTKEHESSGSFIRPILHLYTLFNLLPRTWRNLLPLYPHLSFQLFNLLLELLNLLTVCVLSKHFNGVLRTFTANILLIRFDHLGCSRKQV